jgi:tyrosinase
MKIFERLFKIHWVFLFFVANLSSAQSIRKDFIEMTNYERDELINSFYTLRGGQDLISDIATFHSDFFNFDNTSDETRLDLHYNLPDEPTREIFLVWHRQLLFEVEQAMQNLNPDLSIPYWNSIEEQSTNGLLWNSSWLGPFNSDWDLGRRLGSSAPMPTNNTLNGLLNTSDFFSFSNNLERLNLHRGGHNWVSGAMNTPLSPRDPAFYFHHSFVDKVWQDWENIHQNSSYQRSNMLRYDGTYRFAGQSLPVVNPNNILDSRVLGVFYAENGLAQMDNYIVSNTYRPEEVFYYQFNIEAGDNFIVPNGTASRIVSLNQIKLLPGFIAEPGASFKAYIDQVNLAGKSVQKVREYNPFPYDENINKPIIWEEGETETEKPLLIVTASPNPFQDKITINLNKKINCAIEVYNMMGALVHREIFENTDTLEIHNLYGLSSGFYVIRVVDAFNNPLVIKRVVKM